MTEITVTPLAIFHKSLIIREPAVGLEPTTC
jgi:hypothetical protein